MASESTLKIKLINVQFTESEGGRESQRRLPHATFWFALIKGNNENEGIRIPVHVSGTSASYDDFFRAGHAALRDLLLGWAQIAEQMAPKDKPSE